MAVERIRAFRGATELSYSGLTLTKSNEIMVNRVAFSMEAEASTGIGTLINFTKENGSTSMFTAKLFNRKKEILWEMLGYSNGWELHNIRVEATWTSKSPEYIVADIVDNYTTNLTFASTAVSGITLENYEGKGQYAIDIINDMLDVLQWQMRVDESDNVYFEPGGYIDDGRVLTNGTNFQITNWETDGTQIVNHVKIIGGFISKLFEETASTTGTVFTLAHKPTGNVRIKVSGTLIEPDVTGTLYTVDAETKTVTFATSRINPSFEYEINQPVVIEDQDEDSINAYGMEIFKEVPAPHMNTFTDARKYARSFLGLYSTELVYAEGEIPYLDFDIQVGEIVNVVDNVRGESEQLVINKIVYKADEGTTVLHMGPRSLDFVDWQREVETRIKKLERRINNEDEIAISRLFKHGLKISFTPIVKEWRYKSPVDSFILGHPTLGYLRPDLNYEADCSDNGVYGTWNGTSIAGSQYSISGYRLSCGVFNGTDNYIQASASAGSAQSISFHINSTSNTQKIIRLSSTAYIEVSAGGDIHTTGLSGVTTYVDNVEDQTIGTGSWKTVQINFTAHTCSDLEIGRASTYFAGSIDEVMLYDTALASADRVNIINKYAEETTLLAKCLVWYSMDNPRLGDRFGAYVDIT